MNADSNFVPDKRGILLTDTVDLGWLMSLEPMYCEDFVKFVVNVDTGEIVVGQELHASAKAFLGCDESVLYGGNIFPDGSVVYE